MFGKLFSSMFDGSLYGNWKAIVTLEQLVILANRDGVVDMTLQALAARTSIPLDLLQEGIEHLAKPDPHSRTPGHEGRRIIPVDEARPWGWRIVNYKRYRDLRNEEMRRIQNAEAQDRFRKKSSSGVSTSKRVSAKSANADAEVDVDVDGRTKPLAPSPSAPVPALLPPDPLDAVVVMLPLAKKGAEHVVTERDVKECRELYPGVDVKQQLRNMRGWCLSHPEDRKTPKGIRGFIHRWLSKEQNQGGRGTAPVTRAAVARETSDASYVASQLGERSE